jgi:hypothetical protein
MILISNDVIAHSSLKYVRWQQGSVVMASLIERSEQVNMGSPDKAERQRWWVVAGSLKKKGGETE